MVPNSFRFLRSGALPGAWNMALDEALCGSGAPPRPALRTYLWEPWALSLGWFQAVAAEDVEAYLAAGHDVTRRATGGGAILHGRELTYSLVLPADDPRIPAGVAASYDWVHGAVAEALATVGVRARPRGAAPADAGPDPFFCFRRTAATDLVAEGRKLVGSAQRRTAIAFLQHGSIPLAPDPVAPEATSLASLRGGAEPAVEALEEAMAAAFSRLLGALPQPSGPGPRERDHAAAAVAERFGNRDWVLRPRRRAGRTEVAPTGPVPHRAGPPLFLLRAAVEGDALRVLAEGGGSREALPHSRLHRVDAVEFRGDAGPVPPAGRDPWEATFRRSHFPAPPEAAAGAPPAAGPATRSPGARLVYVRPPRVALLDARRFNFADLGPDRTGDHGTDLARFLARLATAAPWALAPPAPGSPGPAVPPPGVRLT